MSKYYETEVLVVGGGLAGLVAASTLAQRQIPVLLVDNPVPAAGQKSGGFARFSGAKFSLPPAGRGLEPIAGSREGLHRATDDVLEFLGLDVMKPARSIDLGKDDAPIGAGGSLLRSYDSIVLSEGQIGVLLDSLTEKLSKSPATVFRGTCREMNFDCDSWQASIQSHQTPLSVKSRSVFFAGGRLGASLLLRAGALPQKGKGLDIGVRVEFPDREGVSGLRALGPDAKVLNGMARTFCLNSPGSIYYYPFRELMIPGGVVAGPATRSANFGMLFRSPDKKRQLTRVLNASRRLLRERTSPERTKGHQFGSLTDFLRELLGSDCVDGLLGLTRVLEEENLVEWDRDYQLHFPLLDWHWPVFSLSGTLETSKPRLYALGDVSGHARGLLQAAIMGYLATQEYASCQ